MAAVPWCVLTGQEVSLPASVRSHHVQVKHAF
jgi:hypothetical protein